MLAVLRPLVGRTRGKGPFRAGEAVAGAVAARLQGPVALQEHALALLVDPVVVGAGDDLDLPAVLGGDGRAAVQAHAAAGRAVCAAHGQVLALLERVALQAADAGHVEGGARAQHGRRLDAAGDGEVGAGAHACEAGLQHRAGGDGDAFPLRHGRAVEFWGHGGAGEHDHRRALEAERGPEELDFQRCRLCRIADQQVGEPEGPHVEGPRRRKALLPEAVAAGKVLHAGLQAGLEHLDHGDRPFLAFVTAGRVPSDRDEGSWRASGARVSSSCGQPMSGTSPSLRACGRYDVAIFGLRHL